METTSPSTRSIQWRWVGLSFVMYLLCYVLPIVIIGRATAGTSVSRLAQTITVAWAFGGIVVVAAIAAYLSKGITLLEPALASVLMVVLTILTVFVFTNTRWENQYFFRDIILPIAIVFGLSLIGAWFGERLQKLSRKNMGAQSE